MSFLLGQYSIIPKKEISHNQKRTTLEPLGSTGHRIEHGLLYLPEVQAKIRW